MADVEYKVPIVGLKLADSRRRRYEIAAGDEGWFQYDSMVELSEKKYRKLTPTFFPPDLFSEFGDRAIGQIIAIDREEIGGVILRPYVDVLTKEQVLTYYRFLPAVPAEWDFVPSEDGLFTEMRYTRMLDGADEPIQSGVMYGGHQDEITLEYTGACPNVFFAAGLRRQAPTDEMLEELEETDYSNASWSQITWGNDRWLLHIPLKGKPILYEKVPGWWSGGTAFEDCVAACQATLVVCIAACAGDPDCIQICIDAYDECFAACKAGMPPGGFRMYYPPQWVPRQWTEGDLSEVNPRKMSDEGITYKVGIIANAVCVSESSFEDNFACYVVKDRPQPISPAGPIVMTNWPGQCTYWLSPLTFAEPVTEVLHETPSLYRHPFPISGPAVHEEHRGSIIWGTPGPITDVDGCRVDFLGGGGIGEYEGYYAYWLEFYRGEWPHAPEPDDLRTYTTPWVQAVSVYQNANITDHGVQAFTETSRARYSLTAGAQLGTNPAQRYGLTLDNRMALDSPPYMGEGRIPTEDFQIGRMVELSAGWVYNTKPGESTETVNLGQYTIVVPRRDASHGVFGLTDIFGQLALSEWDLGNLNLRGLPVAGAIEFMIALYSIGAAWQDIEDLGISLGGTGWEYSPGTTIASIVADLADRGGQGAAVWYDGFTNQIKTGCKYCRATRTVGNWPSHQDNGWNSTGCRAVDFARDARGYDIAVVDNPSIAEYPGSLYISERLVGEVEAVARDQYANRLTVIGQRDDGETLTAHWQDDEALYDYTNERYTGFPISHVEEDHALQTQAAVNTRLVELAHLFAAWPLMIDLVIPFYATLRPGWVVKVEGGQYIGAHENLFRVQWLAHDIRERQTRVRARRLMDVTEA